MENNHPTPYHELLNEDTKVHIPIEVFIEEIDKEIEIVSDLDNSNYFIIKTANEWIEEAKNRPTGENAHIDHPIALQTDHPKLLFF